MKDEIINLLSHEFPMSAKAIHQKVSSQKSYSYTHKLLKKLVEKRTLTEKNRVYQLSKEHIENIRSQERNIRINYELEKNMFLDSHAQRVLSVLPKKNAERLRNKINSLLEKEIGDTLDTWYTKYYDPEKKEDTKLKELIKGTKTVLEVGCGTGRITQLLWKSGKEVTAIDKDSHALEKAKAKLPDVEFISLDIADFKREKHFDCIVCSWMGLHYHSQTQNIIEKLHELLKPEGKLIVIEPYYSTEYVRILNEVEPRDKNYMQEKVQQLKKNLFVTFGHVKEEILQTKYVFPTREELKQTFRIEFVYEEGTVWNEEREAKLEKALTILKHPLEVGEAPVFFILEKT